MDSRNILRKGWKFLSSMRFAVLLLLVLAAACVGGSLLTQGQSYEWYAARYSQRAAAAILFLHLDNVFHSWWFTGITFFLCLNLLLCNVLRFPALWRRYQGLRRGEGAREGQGEACGILPGEESALQVIRALGFRGEVKNGAVSKHSIGIWGAWVCHLGILILILGFGLGQRLKEEYTVYGVPGQSKGIGDTSLILTIDDFRIDLREDDTVEQYTAQLTVHNAADGSSQSREASVNHPASMYGMKFYQNSTGWAADITVRKDGEVIQRETVCAGEALSVQDKEGLVIYFAAFYPDYFYDAQTGPVSLSGETKNPGYLYRAYYQDQVIGMNVLTGEDVITIDEYTVIFSDPRSYTLIQIRRDPFTPLALSGGLIVVLGLILAFYLQPKRVWIAPGQDGTWSVTGQCKKGGALFAQQLREAVERAGGSMLSAEDTGES